MENMAVDTSSEASRFQLKNHRGMEPVGLVVPPFGDSWTNEYRFTMRSLHRSRHLPPVVGPSYPPTLRGLGGGGQVS